MRRWLIAVCLAGATALSGCVVASPDDDTYRDAAASTLASAAGELATVREMVDLLDRDRIPRPAVVAQLRYSEKTLSAATDSFTSLDPPSSEDALADRSSRLLDDAGTAMTSARLTVHRAETGSYARVVAELDAVVTDLQRLEGSVS